jgi:hypothetical protein
MPPEKSPEVQWTKKTTTKKSGHIIIQLKKIARSTPTVDATEVPGSMTNIAEIVHSLEDNTNFVMETINVQTEPTVLSMDEVQPMTEGIVLIVEMVIAPMLEATNAMPPLPLR